MRLFFEQKPQNHPRLVLLSCLFSFSMQVRADAGMQATAEITKPLSESEKSFLLLLPAQLLYIKVRDGSITTLKLHQSIFLY